MKITNTNLCNYKVKITNYKVKITNFCNSRPYRMMIEITTFLTENIIHIYHCLL